MSLKRALLVLGLSGALATSPISAQDSDYADWFPGSSSTREIEQFPFGFRGVWAPSKEACNDQYGVDLITIYPDGIDSYESGGRLERITQSGQDRTVKAKLSFEGEGGFWDAIWLMKLEPQSNLLRISIKEKAEWESYQRCER